MKTLQCADHIVPLLLFHVLAEGLIAALMFLDYIDAKRRVKKATRGPQQDLIPDNTRKSRVIFNILICSWTKYMVGEDWYPRDRRRSLPKLEFTSRHMQMYADAYPCKSNLEMTSISQLPFAP